MATTYYVRTSGSNSNTGTSSSQAFATIAKAVSVMAAGDTVYVGAGTYRSGSAIAPPTKTSMTYIIADVDGSKTNDAGEVVLTNFSADDTAASAAHIFNFNSVNYWTIRGFTIMQGLQASVAYAVYIQGTSHDLTIEDCTITSFYSAVYCANLTWGTNHKITVERCRIFVANGIGVYFVLPATDGVSPAASSNTNINTKIVNCIIWANYGVRTYTGTTAYTYRTGGISVYNCHIVSGSAAVQTSGLSCGTGTSSRVSVYNSILFSLTGGPVIEAQGANQITEATNQIIGGTAYQNVTADTYTNSNGGFNWRFSLGHEKSFFAPTRPYGEYPPDSRMLYFTLAGSAPPTLDLAKVTRPASSYAQTASMGALGPLESSNAGVRSTVYRTTSPSLFFDGAGYQDFELPVSASHATTVSVYVCRNGDVSSIKPSMSVLGGGQCGVADATVSDTGSKDAWNQLSLSFTPASDGIVTIRLRSYTDNTNVSLSEDWVWFDDFSYS